MRTRKYILLALVTCLFSSASFAERIKDLASMAGVRNNQLVGYGLVVGLDGTGDQTSQAPFTTQGVINMLGIFGVTFPIGTNLQLKNIAAVMVTAQLPPYAQPGQQLDITVSSLANAKSLRGGTLIMTPLKGADSVVYAIAQGNIIVGGAGGQGGGTSVTVNHLAAGRIPAGATVELAVPTPVGMNGFAVYELNNGDFSTANRVSQVINGNLGNGTAQALDARRIQVRLPESQPERIAFLAKVDNLQVTPEQAIAKVIVNSRTGSVVMNQTVSLQECAVAHGNLTVTISENESVSQPNAFAGGRSVVTENGQVDVKQQAGGLIRLKAGVSLADVVRALNSVGANPLDLINILQAMKSAGALRAELEVI